MITIVLADNHHLVRTALKRLLEEEAGFSIVGEAANGVETIEVVYKIKPMVLLVDLAMPRIPGVDVIREVVRRNHTKVIVISMLSAAIHVAEALRQGARGYVIKDSMPDDLARAIREVAAGETHLSPGLSITDPSKYDELALTCREKTVLHLAAEGCSNPEIATQLFISTRTVESHRSSLMHKLNLHSQTELVRFAIRNNIISA